MNLMKSCAMACYFHWNVMARKYSDSRNLMVADCCSLKVLSSLGSTSLKVAGWYSLKEVYSWEL
jgi:hypothetical protein